ncbi:hypothetical protein DL96DRAFT_669235 [Flagelloscypha sp. PMI_526]|nr:hypothetical protein DL96DRAFT_669235 [Flagelloscypha sp. PMI_526]
MLSTALFALLPATAVLAASSSTCKPDFQSRSVSVVSNDGNLEWGTGELKPEGVVAFQSVSQDDPEFIFTKMDASWNNTYLIRPLNTYENLLAGLIPGGNGFQWVTPPEGVAAVNIECDYCSTSDPAQLYGAFAKGCRIMDTNQNWCARVRDGVIGESVRLLPCTGTDNEKFTFMLGKNGASAVPSNTATSTITTSSYGPTSGPWVYSGSGSASVDILSVSGALEAGESSSSSSSSVSTSLDKWLPVLLGLLVGNILLTVIVAGFTVLSFLRRRQGRSYRRVSMRDDASKPFMFEPKPYNGNHE